jgi:hypothetical protein
VTLFGGSLDILRISNPLASNQSSHKVEWIRSTGEAGCVFRRRLVRVGRAAWAGNT